MSTQRMLAIAGTQTSAIEVFLDDKKAVDDFLRKVGKMQLATRKSVKARKIVQILTLLGIGKNYNERYNIVIALKNSGMLDSCSILTYRVARIHLERLNLAQPYLSIVPTCKDPAAEQEHIQATIEKLRPQRTKLSALIRATTDAQEKTSLCEQRDALGQEITNLGKRSTELTRLIKEAKRRARSSR